MTDRAVLTLSSPAIREKAKRWIEGVPDKTRVTFLGPKRTLPQNSRLWSALKVVSAQVKYHGLKLSADDFKTLFMDALWRETRMVQSLENDGMVALRRSSADLSVKEAEQLIALIYEWGYRNGVVFSVDARDGISPPEGR